MNKRLDGVFSLIFGLIGCLLACASLLLLLWLIGNPDGNGTLSVREWVMVLFPASMSVLSFAAIWRLWRSAKE